MTTPHRGVQGPGASLSLIPLLKYHSMSQNSLLDSLLTATKCDQDYKQDTSFLRSFGVLVSEKGGGPAPAKLPFPIIYRSEIVLG